MGGKQLGFLDDELTTAQQKTRGENFLAELPHARGRPAARTGQRAERAGGAGTPAPSALDRHDELPLFDTTAHHSWISIKSTQSARQGAKWYSDGQALALIPE